MTDTEIWKPIPGFNRYFASSYGRIRGAKGGIMKPQYHRDGYQILTVTPTGGKPHSATIHRLVALAFLGPRPDGHDVAHWDGDKTNNGPFNLRYCKRSDNMADERRLGKKRVYRTLPVGWTISEDPRGKLTPDDRRQIVELVESGIPQRDVAKMFDVCRQCVSQVWNGACESVSQ